MDFQQFGDTYILKLEQHDELTREIKKFCTENNISNAQISALGVFQTVIKNGCCANAVSVVVPEYKDVFA